MTHRLLTLQQTAAILQVPYPRAASLARVGLIPAIRIGRQVRIDPAELQRFIAEGGAGVPHKVAACRPLAEQLSRHPAIEAMAGLAGNAHGLLGRGGRTA